MTLTSDKPERSVRARSVYARIINWRFWVFLVFFLSVSLVCLGAPHLMVATATSITGHILENPNGTNSVPFSFVALCSVFFVTQAFHGLFPSLFRSWVYNIPEQAAREVPAWFRNTTFVLMAFCATNAVLLHFRSAGISFMLLLLLGFIRFHLSENEIRLRDQREKSQTRRTALFGLLLYLFVFLSIRFDPFEHLSCTVEPPEVFDTIERTSLPLEGSVSIDTEPTESNPLPLLEAITALSALPRMIGGVGFSLLFLYSLFGISRTLFHRNRMIGYIPWKEIIVVGWKGLLLSSVGLLLCYYNNVHAILFGLTGAITACVVLASSVPVHATLRFPYIFITIFVSILLVLACVPALVLLPILLESNPSFLISALSLAGGMSVGVSVSAWHVCHLPVFVRGMSGSHLFFPTKLPTHWILVPQQSTSHRVLDPTIKDLLDTELTLGKLLGARMRSPQTESDFSGAAFRHKNKSLSTKGTSLEGIWLTFQDLVSRSHNKIQMASPLFDGLDPLRAFAWMLNPRLFQYDLLKEPVETLRVLTFIIQKESNLPLLLFWKQLEIRASVLLGDLSKYLALVQRYLDFVLSPDLEDALGAGHFTDLQDSPWSDTPYVIEDQDWVPPLRSSANRAHLLLHLACSVEHVRHLAELGGDSESIASLRTQANNIKKNIKKHFGVDAGAETLQFGKRITKQLQMELDVERLQELPAAESMKKAASILNDIIDLLWAEGYSPLLASAEEPVAKLSKAIASRWMEVKRDSLILPSRQKIPNDLYDQWADSLGTGKLPDEIEEGFRKAKEETYFEPWKTSPEQCLSLWRCATLVLWHSGIVSEAKCLAEQYCCLASKLGDFDDVLDATAVRQRVSDKHISPVDGAGLAARRSRVQSLESLVHRASEAAKKPEAILNAIESTVRRPPEWEQHTLPIRLDEGDALLVQILLPSRLVSLFMTGEMEVSDSRLTSEPLQRTRFLQKLSNLIDDLNPEGIVDFEESAKEISDTVLKGIPTVHGTLYYLGHGALARLPISALPFNDDYLGRTTRLVRIDRPSRAHSWTKTDTPRRAAYWWDQGSRPLPNASPECDSLPGFEVEKATKESVCKALQTLSFVHLACHGRKYCIETGDADLELSDTPLTATQIRALQVEAPLVYLSACESAKGSLVPGEPSTGLAGALLDAGASQVVATQWVLPDEEAPVLAKRFWTELSNGVTPAEALRRARCESDNPGCWAAVELHQGSVNDKVV